MKIGIYDDGTINQRGGGFTFKNEIIHGLINTKVDPGVDIFIFGWENSTHRVFNSHGPIKYYTIRVPLLLKLMDQFRKVLHRTVKQIYLSINDVNRKTIINPSINAMSIFSEKRSKILEKNLLALETDLVIYMEAQEILTYRIPYICISWDLGHMYIPFFPETNFDKWNVIEKIKSEGLKRAFHILTGTEIGKKQIHSQYRIPEERISVLPFPTPIYLLKEKCDTPQNIPGHFDLESDFLFYPASYWPHKNHVLLIEAMDKLVNEKGMDIHLVLCGADKGNKKYIDRLIDKYRLRNRILSLDFLDRGELNYLYSKAFALVFSSFVGPDNLPPLEAFALGCPVIASAVEGSKEQLGDNALLFDPFSSEDLIDKIILLKNNKELRELLIKTGLEKSQKWTSDDYAGELVTFARKFESYSRCFDLKTYMTRFA